MSDNDKTNDNNKKTSTDASPTEDQAFVETFEDPIKLYLREITDHPLLSFEQEFRLGIAVQAEELAKAIEDDTHSLLLSALLKTCPQTGKTSLMIANASSLKHRTSMSYSKKRANFLMESVPVNLHICLASLIRLAGETKIDCGIFSHGI